VAVKHSVPVLIVGAGPTGLTAAIELSRLGIGVRIIDRAPERSLTSRALGIQARTVELLRVRGVGNEMLRLGNRANTTTLYSGGEKLAAIGLHRMPSEFNYVLLLAQSETERLLTEQLNRQGVKVERGVEMVSVSRRPDHLGVRLRSGDGAEEAVTASYLIAADGSHSAIRKALGLPFRGRSLTQSYVLGDLYLAGDVPEDQLSIFLARNGFLAVFPMGDGRFRFMATDPDAITGDTGDPTLDDIQRLYDRTVHLPAQLYNLNWSSRFRINSRHMTTLRDGRVFFGGDAAHVHSPAGGQGMSAGVQDMINLSWKLAMVLKGQARPELLDLPVRPNAGGPPAGADDRTGHQGVQLHQSARARRPDSIGSRPARPVRRPEQGGAETGTARRRLPRLPNCQGRRANRAAARRRPAARRASRRSAMLRHAGLVHPDLVRYARRRADRRRVSPVAEHPCGACGVDSRRAGQRCSVAAGAAGRLSRGRRRSE
jgi:2-polyprenyl-6-methoxyphenol hydroxylase-like FAD-dependent oxidoreductase